MGHKTNMRIERIIIHIARLHTEPFSSEQIREKLIQSEKTMRYVPHIMAIGHILKKNGAIIQYTKRNNPTGKNTNSVLSYYLMGE